MITPIKITQRLTLNSHFLKNNQNLMEYDQQCTRNKGLRSTGKIFKGTLNQAPIKIRVSSIPSKHQNIIYHAPSRHAFGNSQTRFAYQQQKQQFTTPSPCQYQSTSKQIQRYSVSSGKKGTGPFVSQTDYKRFQLDKNPYPAPGQYECKPSLNVVKKTKTKSTIMSNSQFSPNKTQSSVIQIFKKAHAHDLFRQQMIESSKRPGPGQYTFYNSSLHLQAKINRAISTGNLPFKSKVQRFKVNDSQVPPVGNYQCSFKSQKPETINFSFPKKVSNIKKQQFIQKIVAQRNDDTSHPHYLNAVDAKNQRTPGPGAYEAYKSFTQTQKSFKIKEGIHDRFGQLKHVYQIAKHDSEYNTPIEKSGSLYDNTHKDNKNLNPSSVFVSKVQRMKFEEPLMDPAKYKVTSPEKKSHLINYNKKWV